MKFLRQSTAATIKAGPFLDATDGATAETGLSLTAKVSKNGASMAARSDATAITHDADGYYAVALNTTDTNTVGRLRLSMTASGALPVWEDFTVLSGAMFDALFGAAPWLPASSYVAAPSANANADAVAAKLETDGVVLASDGLDGVEIEAGLDARQTLSLIAAALAGAVSGAGTTSVTIKGAGVSANRIVATVDASGNRSALTLSPPA